MIDPPVLNGLLIVDKEPGFTSMDVCAILRTRLRRGGAPKRVKVGHAGTLDPLATGVLVVLVGRATRLCDQYMGGRKRYEATIDFSATSSTDDAEGERSPVTAATIPDEAAVRNVIKGFVGVISQRPPVYSAMKIGGKRAYALARAGETPVMVARPVEVHAFELVGYAWPDARVVIDCGKGTYVRSMARDLGAALGVGGMLTALRRTRVGEFGIEKARVLGAIPDVLTQGDLLTP